MKLVRIIERSAPISWQVVTPQLMRRAARQQSIAGTCLACAFLVPLTARAQQEAADRFITTSAVGQVSLPPDHARVTFGVVARAATASEAAARIAAVMANIRDSLIAAGVPPDSVPTMGYTVRRQRSFQSDSLLGYDAETSVIVTIRDLTRIGSIIEAVLGAGANDISGLQFLATDRRAARDEAIAMAVTEAQRDAMALATAAGAELGELVDLSTAAPLARGAFLDEIVVTRSRTVSQTMSISVVPRDVVVRVQVTGRWRVQVPN